MDLKKWKNDVLGTITKYKYVILVLILGIALMALPEKQKPEAQGNQVQTASVQYNSDIGEELEQILTKIDGAGAVKVLLTIGQGERVVYQTDTTYTQSEDRTESQTQTILVTDNNRSETGLIHQKDPPKYQGAIILVQGADNPTVKLSIVDAVTKATGLGADKISVQKMK